MTYRKLFGKCPKCNAFVHRDKLEEHLLEIHNTKISKRCSNRSFSCEKERTVEEKVYNFYEIETVIADLERKLLNYELNSKRRRDYKKMIERLNQTKSDLNLQSSELDKYQHIKLYVQSHNEKIILDSKRATRVGETNYCDNCHTRAKVSWLYAESNRGAVHICGRCKPSVYSRSFGMKDALDVALQGGQFESNRRKH